MFDAKSILDVLMKGAQPPPPQQTPQGGLGGLADILGQVLGGAQKPGAAPHMAPGSQGGGQGGGLGDILEQFQKQLGGAAGQGNAPAQAPSGGGGLADILGQLQKQLGQPGQAAPQQNSPPAQGGGGLMDILGQILGQATSGAREGAGRINEATGVGDRAREAIGQATGRSPDELLAQLQEWIKNNPGAAAAGAGGLGAVVLGTRTGRSLAGTAAKLGALALIGGLAYKAYQNYAQGRPLISGGDTGRLLSEPAPNGSGFEPDAISNDTAILYIRAMIAAAAADGRIDRSEHQNIIGGLQQAGIGAEAQAFLQQEIQNPASIEDLAQACSSGEEAVQVYTAARLAIDPDTEQESEFLTSLAQQLGMDANLVAHIDATAAAAS